MSLNFCAIDFETGSFDRSFAIQIGLVKVLNGEIVDTFTSLIKPIERHTSIDPRAQALHGITMDDVKDAPTWPELYPTVTQFVGSLPVLAHNLSFDSGVLEAICEDAELPFPDWPVGDTLPWCRTLLRLDSHGLANVASHLGIEQGRAHRAEDDARTCALIAIQLADLTGVHSVESIGQQAMATVVKLQTRIDQLRRNRRKTPVTLFNPEELKQVLEFLATQPLPPRSLEGHQVVFTGALGILREDATVYAQQAGATVTKSVNKHTTVLVVGTARRARFFTNKLNRAVELQVQGTLKHILSEEQFYQLIDFEE
ncbi:exonuclease domain-containing protein [Stomatohabitans albus]|uniref:exonuclease domain-containing protein n=1 Tax=Stomatohabitans albus TaxID=3110766 RepID=UPI00300CD52D